MLNSAEEKNDVTVVQQTDFDYDHPLSYLYTIKFNESLLFVLICEYMDIQSLCRLSVSNKEFNFISSAEDIWKPRCLKKWPELKMAKSLEEDPFPIYKSCYKRKASSESTSMQDLMNIFGHCDWYQFIYIYIYQQQKLQLFFLFDDE